MSNNQCPDCPHPSTHLNHLLMICDDCGEQVGVVSGYDEEAKPAHQHDLITFRMCRDKTCRFAEQLSEATALSPQPDVIRFLLGEAPLDGVWFGEKLKGKPEFWWRKKLREALSDHQDCTCNSGYKHLHKPGCKYFDPKRGDSNVNGSGGGEVKSFEPSREQQPLTNYCDCPMGEILKYPHKHNPKPYHLTKSTDWEQADLMMRFPKSFLDIVGKHSKHWNYSKMETLQRISDWLADQDSNNIHEALPSGSDLGDSEAPMPWDWDKKATEKKIRAEMDFSQSTSSSDIKLDMWKKDEMRTVPIPYQTDTLDDILEELIKQNKQLPSRYHYDLHFNRAKKAIEQLISHRILYELESLLERQEKENEFDFQMAIEIRIKELSE